MSVFVWNNIAWGRKGKDYYIYLWARDIVTKKLVKFNIKNFKPHFYVADKNGKELNCFGAPITRIDCNNPDDLTAKRELYKASETETFDSDIPYDKQYLIDKHIVYAFDEKMQPIEVSAPIEPLTVFYDIELNIPKGEPIDAERNKFPIVAISTFDTYSKTGKVFTIGTEKVHDLQVPCGDEKALIQAFFNYIEEVNPDILGGWNCLDFDMPYILGRAKLYNISTKQLTRMKYEVSKADRLAGRTHIDMMEFFKDWSKPIGQMPTYGLKYISKHFADFEYEAYGAEIQTLIAENKWHTLVEYNLNDVIALQKINNKANLIGYHENLRRIIGIKFDRTIKRTDIVETLLMRHGIKPMPHRKKRDAVSFEGALVIQPTAGIKENVIFLDAKSLYPSIIIAFNLSPDIDGMIPKTITFMLNEREKYRALKLAGKATEADETTEQSLKYIANSFYGVMGSPYFKLYDPDIAQFITKTGQEINKSIQKVVKDKGYDIMAGDSIAGDTLLSTSKGLIKIQDLFSSVDYTDDSKEYSLIREPLLIDTINEKGVAITTNVKYIMRHKVDKQMYRVWMSNNNYIDVTEDHSLFGVVNKNIVALKPTSNIRNVVWRKSSTVRISNSRNYPKELYEFMGYFVGDGCYGVAYKNTIKKNNSLKLSTGLDSEETINKLIIPLQKMGYVNNYSLSKTRKGDVSISGVKICRMMDEFKSIHGKIVPEFIYYETQENIRAFMRGWFSADGTVMIRDNRPMVRLTSITKEHIIAAQELLAISGVGSNWFKESRMNSYLGKCSGTYSYHLCVKNNKEYRDKVGFLLNRKQDRLALSVETKPSHYEVGKIKKIEKIETPEYVYDLEVTDESHRYFANNILVHNTDSVAASPVKDVAAGKQLESEVNTMLLQWAKKHGVKDEFAPVVKFEKFFKRLFFKKKTGSDEAAKKKYCGYLIWKDGHKKDELSYTGIEIKRSDTAPYTKEIMETFFQKVLIDGKIEEAVNDVKTSYNNVLKGRVPAQKIAIPKAVHATTIETAHIKGARNGTALLGIRFDASKKPKLLYCVSPYKEICIDDETSESIIREKITIDNSKMANRVVEQKMRSLIESLGYSWDRIVCGQTSLFMESEND